ncbi:hypothetical protein Tco_0954842 [Tanacetum coccineum]|uniref:Uncharacterized protein n=1 Tax=Tanacetum coccineum TaxID=301880 RepID=A0ABQ5E5G8_9ASTR
MVFNSPSLTDNDKVDSPLRGNQLTLLLHKELASPEQMATAEVVPKFVAGSSFPTAGSTYVVPTGRVVVLTSMYVVPASKVIIKVSPGRLILVPTGRILSPGRVK